MSIMHVTVHCTHGDNRMNEDNYYDFLTKMTFKAPHEVTQAIYEHWMNTPKDNILVNLSASVESLHKANIEKSKKIWKLFLSM